MRWIAVLLAPLLWLALSSVAQAQCPPTNASPQFNSGGSVFGQNAGQWNLYFGHKVDATNGTLCNPTISGGTIPSSSVGPGLTAVLGTFNPGTQQATNGSIIYPQLYPRTKAGNYVVDADGGGVSDSGALLIAHASGITFSAPNPTSLNIGVSYNFASDGTNGYTLTTVGGSALFYGCPGGGSSSLVVAANFAVTITSDGANYVCRSGTTSNGDVIGPGGSNNRGIAFYNGTTGKLLQDESFIYDSVGLRLTAPNNASFTLQGAGGFQVGGTGGPYVYNDTALDTVSIIAVPGALPSGNTTNLQVYAPIQGEGALLNLTRWGIPSPLHAERLIIGADPNSTDYIWSQVFEGTGVCRDTRFENGTSTAFHISCSTPANLLIDNNIGVFWYMPGATNQQDALRLDASANLNVATGSSIAGVVFRKHLASNIGSMPTASSCGGSPVVVSGSDDNRGSITVGSGTVTSCIVNFSAGYSTSPIVVVAGETTGSNVLTISATNGTSFSVASSGNMSTETFNYFVIQ